MDVELYIYDLSGVGTSQPRDCFGSMLTKVSGPGTDGKIQPINLLRL
jgi:hypothetical protein